MWRVVDGWGLRGGAADATRDAPVVACDAPRPGRGMVGMGDLLVGHGTLGQACRGASWQCGLRLQL